MASSIAVVTGAASGIGLALTKHLLTRDPPYRVCMIDLPHTRGAEIALSLGHNALFIEADTSNFTQQSLAFAKAFAWGGGRLDFLAANAAIADTQILHDEVKWDGQTEVEPLETTAIDVDLVAVLQGIWLFKHYASRTRATVGDSWVGKIVMTSSPAGLYCPSTLPLYVAAKAALIALTYSVAPPFGNPLRSTGRILINTVLPGFVKTGLAPPDLLDIFPAEHITPMETVIRAFKGFVARDDVMGTVAECSLDRIHTRVKGGGTGYVDESSRWIGEESGVLFGEAYERELAKKGRRKGGS